MISIVICALFGVFSIFTIRHTEYVFSLTIVNFILTLIQHSFSQLGNMCFTIAGITVGVTDIYIITLIVIAVLRIDGGSFTVKKSNLLFFGYTLLVCFSVIVGLKQNGLGSDWISEIRKFSKIVILCIYFSKYPVEFNNTNMKVLNLTMRGILVFCWLCWGSALGIGVYITGNNSLRCIGSDWAFILSVYTAYLFYRDLILSENKKVTIETLLYTVSIIILQHNSVYMTLAGGILTILIIKRDYLFRKHNMWVLQVVGVLVIGSVVLSMIPNSPLITMISTTMDKFSQALSTTSGSEEGTIGTRYIVWKELIATLNSPFDWMFGKSMGTGYHVRYMNSVWQNSPHSGYVEGLMRVGLIGMICLIGQIINNLFRHIRRGDAVWAAFLIMTLIYWYSYSYTVEIGFLIGMSMAIASNNVYLKNEEDTYSEYDFEKMGSHTIENPRSDI